MSNSKDLIEGVCIANGLPCDKHGGSDSLSVYEKTTSEGEIFYDANCWSECGYISPKDCVELGIVDDDGNLLIERQEGAKRVITEEEREFVKSVEDFDCRGVRERKIPLRIAQRYGMRVKYKGDTEEIHAHYYPVHNKDSGEITGYYQRVLPKNFSSIGEVKNAMLQGQHLFDKGGVYSSSEKVTKKFLVLTEGYLDMLATATMLDSEKYITPVVSLPNGTQSIRKSCTNNYDFMNSFELIIFAHDQDDAGKQALIDLRMMFGSSKVRGMTFRENDPCEMRKKGLDAEFRKSFWNTQEETPSQILTVDDIFEKALKSPEMGLSLPWESATRATLGIRRGEIHIVGAAPKIG